MKSESKLSRLNRLLTHSHWSGGGEGAKYYAMQQMNTLSSTIQSDINCVRGQPEGFVDSNFELDLVGGFLHSMVWSGRRHISKFGE
jgi:hypothetical protein